MTTPTKEIINFAPLQIPLDAAKPFVRTTATNESIPNTDDSDDLQHLQHAIKITNKFLLNPVVIFHLKQLIEDENDSEANLLTKWSKCERKIKEITVSFKPAISRWNTAWFEGVERGGETNMEVAVNHFFQHRLRNLEEELTPSAATPESTSIELRNISIEKEDTPLTREEIVVFIGIAILHEVAHLMIRWTGKLSTPVIFNIGRKKPDAGDYLEVSTFSGIVRIFAAPKEGIWTKEHKYKGLGTFCVTYQGTKKCVFSDEWIENVYYLSYTDIRLYIHPTYMPDDSSVKRRDENEDEDEDENEDDNGSINSVTSQDYGVSLEELGVPKCGGVYIRIYNDEPI